MLLSNMLRALSQKFNSLFLGIKWRFLGFTAFTPFPCFILRRGVSLYIKTVFHNQNGNRFFTKFYHTTKWKEYYLSSRSFCSKYHMLHLWVYILLFSLYHSWYFYLCIVVFFLSAAGRQKSVASFWWGRRYIRETARRPSRQTRTVK